jgi:hypothetical protein
MSLARVSSHTLRKGRCGKSFIKEYRLSYFTVKEIVNILFNTIIQLYKIKVTPLIVDY